MLALRRLALLLLSTMMASVAIAAPTVVGECGIQEGHGDADNVISEDFCFSAFTMPI